MALGQTVTVVNKSGKVVSTGKHLVNVFKEVKSAYRERKAEITALRHAEESEKQARRAFKDLSMDDDDTASRNSSRRSHKSSRSNGISRRDHAPIERGYTDSFYANEQRTSRRQRPRTSRSVSLNDVDMDLAYGELPPPLPARPYDQEVELRNKMTSLQVMLVELNCVQYSVMAMIENLQKNPDTLAAVALTLGEISSIASKMAPGVITALKGSFPAIIALLASPEFLIAVGVGVGVTVIMLGGYKIIKKIQQRTTNKPLLEEGSETAENESVPEFDELREIDSELSRIEIWRRGIADAEAVNTPGTSVEGEFITPGANKYLVAEGVLHEDDLKSTKSGKKSRSKKSKGKDSSSKDKAKKDRKKKEPSGLRMLFKSR
ncbi:hypothetical protein BDV97DRAFT_331948 [Delphinella strobiligena]|nr:hypothetical protein BDV97DRAFT_331948 [Delphinella strobiligena]